jgi:hypothetical protein
MNEIVRNVDAIEGRAYTWLVEEIAFDDFRKFESAGETC